MRFFLSMLMVFALAGVARAGDLFSLTAQTSSTTVTASGHNLVDLTDNLINTQDQFSSVSGQDFTASLKYGGLNNAINFSENAAGTTATLTIPSTGFTKTFNGANSADLQNQIEDFLKKDGSTEVSKFLQKINELTLVGVTDGNPLATTALLSRQTFGQFGFHSNPFDMTGMAATVGRSADFRIDVDAGVFDTDEADGYVVSLTLTSSYHFSDRVALVLATPLLYRNIEDAAVYQAAFELGLPIVIIPSRGDGTFGWQITPSGDIAGAASGDLVSGGLLWAVHGTSRLSYKIGEWTIAMANQYGYYQGTPIEVSGYKFDTDVDQQILRNGVQVTKMFGPNFFVDAGVSYSNFLNDAAVESYWSPEAGLGWRFGQQRGSGLRIGYLGDYGSGFTVHGASLTAFFNY